MRLRTSSAGLISTTSSEPSWPAVGDHLHAQLHLAIGRPAAARRCRRRARPADRGNRGRSSRAGACPRPRRASASVMVLRMPCSSMWRMSNTCSPSARIACFSSASTLRMPMKSMSSGRDRGALAAPAHQRLRTVAQQASHRHAVQVAAGADGFGVDVGVRVQPDHAQVLALAPAACRATALMEPMARQWSPPISSGTWPAPSACVTRVEHRAVPGHHFFQVPQAAAGHGPGVGRPGQVALVLHVQLVRAQLLDQARDPQRVRPHAGAAHARADVGGRADQGNGFHRGHCERADSCFGAATSYRLCCGTRQPAGRCRAASRPAGPGPRSRAFLVDSGSAPSTVLINRLGN